DRRPIARAFLGILSRVSAIGFANSTKTLLKGAKTVAVIGPAPACKQRSLPKLLGKKLDNLLRELAKELEPGDLGAAATSVAGADPGRLALGVLPDQLSRYNSETRADCVRRVMAQIKAAPGICKGKVALILV